MPSFSAISAAAILAFSGMASAIPQYNFSNTTAPATGSNSTTPVGPGSGSNSTTPVGPGSGSNSTTPGSGSGSGAGNGTVPALDGKFCPGLDLSIYIDRSGFSYQIECDTNHFGTIIDIQVNLTRRAVPASLDDCLNLCDATASCVGTAFDTNARTCTLFSDVQAAYAQQGIQFGQRVANGGSGSGSGNGATTITAGGLATSTIYSTQVVTIASCAPTVTNCPLNAVVTQVIPVSSTVYVCPTQTVIPAGPIACNSCPYTASTATVFSATGGSMVPVSTTVYACPQATGTTVVVEVCTACAKPTGPAGPATTGPAVQTQTVTLCNGEHCPATATATGASNTMAVYTGASKTATNTMAVYTGAASNVKAGMGFAAMVAGAALVL
ncbi:hypothetical protein E4T47_04192 [Aureobasidium subglaciale]|nr:hypothetical protein E4T47_04192 [Aureobasidium subglaciale]